MHAFVTGGSGFVGRNLIAQLLARTAACLMGEEVIVNDTKARRELGHVGKVSIEAGLAEMGL